MLKIHVVIRFKIMMDVERLFQPLTSPDSILPPIYGVESVF